MIRVLSSACAGLGIAALAWGYAGDGYAITALALLLFGVVWLVGQWRRWVWLSTMGSAVTAATAAAGLGLGVTGGWMIAGAVGGLLAWDLAEFDHRLCSAAPTDNRRALEGRHLAWLGLAVGIGLLLAVAAGLIRLRLSFGWAVLLALAGALGTARLASRLRRSA
jgi:hypothetical protein